MNYLKSTITAALLAPVILAGAQQSWQVPPSGSYVVENVADLNSQFLDYCAVPFGNGVFFTSARGGNGVFVCDQDLVTGRYSDLYFAVQDREGRFFAPEMVRGDINGKYHDGAPTFTPDGNTMIFSRNNRDGQSTTGLIDLKIYSASRSGSTWVNTAELPFNSDDFATCHPTLSDDGQVLYFASNRPGGYGGMDIYASQKQGDTWGQPINLGAEVNSEGHEIFPFITVGNTLYFSSDGRPNGMGGLDVYSSQVSGLVPSEALRLPAPVNSAHDDFAFTADRTESKGFLTSNRTGGKGQDDIYRWSFSGVRPMLANICVVDKATEQRIDDANLRVQQAEFPGLVAATPYRSAIPEYVVLYTEVGSAGSSRPVAKSCAVKVPVVAGEVYNIEVSKEGYLPTRLQVSAKQLTAVPEFLVPIEAMKKAVSKGVVRNRADETPLPGSTVQVLNKCTGQVEEFTTDAKGSFQFLLDCHCEYEVLATKAGFTKGQKLLRSDGFDCGQDNSVIAMYLDLEPAVLEVGTVIELENVYYDYNKFNIRPDAAEDLDHVVELMKKYPTLEIELGSHTDARGSDEYNLSLSQNRANAAVEYIVSKGVAKRRLKAKGYGETELVNHCANDVECDDATHEQNRRTEIKITRLEEKGVKYK